MELKDRFTGCLLGLALGDALGAPFEGSPPGEDSGFEDIVAHPPPVLTYTDDTEMAMGVAESLAKRNGFNPCDMARRFAKNFNPTRGYGLGAIAVLEHIRDGMHWEKANRMVFPRGSFGNGAAMRAAPIGLFFSHDMDVLREVTYTASGITHAHPLGQEGALLITRSVAEIVNGRSREDIAALLPYISSIGEYDSKLAALASLLRSEPTGEEVIQALGNGVAAHESAPTAVYAFVRYGDDYMETVRYCVSLGGDTDTISAMAGALAGAYLGEKGLPGRLLERLEDGEKLRELAESLHDSAILRSL